MAGQTTEREKDRRVQSRGFVYGALAVLAAAAIAAGSSVWTASVQSDSARDQAREDFLRSQRQTAYADLLSADAKAAAAITAYADLVGDARNASTNEADDALTALYSVVARIEIIGDKSVRHDAEQILYVERDYMSSLLRASDNGQTDNSDIKSQSNGKRAKAVGAFIEEARKDSAGI